MDKYCLEDGYVSRPYCYFNDPKDGRYGCQYEVYNYAKSLMLLNNWNTVLDIGCGSGEKLIKMFDKYKTVGTDVQETLNFLKNKYPNNRWELSDFSNPLTEEFDLVICADVIEHIEEPEILIEYLLKLNTKAYVISTPDGDWINTAKFGPPINVCHVREWTKPQFKQYMGKYFNIIHQDCNKGNQWIHIEK